MTAALHGLRVWITRPIEGAGRSADQWSARGAEVVLAPVLELEGVDPGPGVRAVLSRRSSRETVVALTSAIAATFFARAVGPHDFEGRPWSCAAVGGKTADLARELGLRVEHVAARATAADLAVELAERMKPLLVLFPGSDRRRNELPRHLRARGIQVLDFTLYRNRPLEPWDPALCARLRDGRLDLVAVYSPSAVDAVVEGWPPDAIALDAIAFASLGPTTRDALHAHGLRPAVSPEDPGEPALLSAVEEWWRGRSQT